MLGRERNEGAGGSSSDPIHCHSARRDQLHAGVKIVLSSGGNTPDDEHIAHFLSYAAERGIDLSILWIAERRGRIVWAVLPICNPGRTALLLGPPPAPADASAAGAALEGACRQIAAGDTRLVQVLLDPAHSEARRFYAAHAFLEIAELIYLQAPVRRSTVSAPLPLELEWATYSPQTHAQFATAISTSYEQSLDCPRLNGMREIEDIIAGHKAAGVFDPSLWFVLRTRPTAGDSPSGSGPSGVLGVLLLSPLPQVELLELVYLGLSPAARGRGLGDIAVRHTLAMAAARGFPRVSLSVDALNVPAMKLYFRFGFRRGGSKLAVMRLLEPG